MAKLAETGTRRQISWGHRQMRTYRGKDTKKKPPGNTKTRGQAGTRRQTSWGHERWGHTETGTHRDGDIYRWWYIIKPPGDAER